MDALGRERDVIFMLEEHFIGDSEGFVKDAIESGGVTAELFECLSEVEGVEFSIEV